MCWWGDPSPLALPHPLTHPSLNGPTTIDPTSQAGKPNNQRPAMSGKGGKEHHLRQPETNPLDSGLFILGNRTALSPMTVIFCLPFRNW